MLLVVLLALLAQDPSLAQEEGDDFGAGLAVLGDVNGDGVDDFAVSDPWATHPDGGWGWLGAVSGRTQRPIWEVRGGEATGGCGCHLTSLGDVDGDGVYDLAESSNTPGLRLRSGASGELLYTLRGFRAAPVGDIDGDGAVDLTVLGARSGRLVSGATGEALGVRPAEGGSLLGGGKVLALGDLDQDGSVDWGIVSPAGLHLLNCEEDLRLDGSLRLHALGLPRDPFAGPIVAAVSNNGGRIHHGEQRTIVQLTDDIGVRLLLFRPEEGSGRGSSVTDEVQLQREGRPPHGLFLETLGDVSGDGVEDYLVGVDDCLVFTEMLPGVRSGADGTPIWSYPRPEVICNTAMASIGDLDDDGVRDVLVSGSWTTGAAPITGWVEALSGATGKQIFRLERADLRH